MSGFDFDSIMNKKKPASLQQKKIVATALSADAGVSIKPKEITAKSVDKAKAIADTSADPMAIAAQFKEKADGGLKLTSSQKIYLALAAALPTVIGAAIGGAEGGAIGANATGKFFSDTSKSLLEDEKSRTELANKLEVARIGADEKNQAANAQRDFQAEQNALQRQQSQENASMNIGLKRDLALDKQEIRESALAEKITQRTVSGYGEANTIEDAKDLKAAIVSKRSFNSKIDELIALRESKAGGAILDREAVARAALLSKDLLLAYKDMAKLGVLSVADEKILNAIIPPNPLEFNSPLAAVQGQDPILNNLKQFRADSEKDFQTRLSIRLRPGQQKTEQPLDAPDFDSMSVEELKKFLGN